MTDLLSRRLIPSADALLSPVGEETVILHLGNDTYYGLDPMGTRIWAMLGEGVALAAIRDRLAAQHGVAAATVEADLRRFLDDLLRHGLLVDG
ncbi:hypothetical protein Rumeso_03388 [Rubellimicrobium mesophilum DSM 19309]|uniref:PqqD family protein n=1 Tax=Rubellimicrobium mesophilum DSM 19309 TaxID=442562 RepID=A0A017HL87_9RHOB|nr:PqqD family protein [Rubellimicrobium mesophilum]EYD75060.1 hypothetical protein Rumeso_03388 [Rubellimicrobium mesophilum DSM 19309]